MLRVSGWVSPVDGFDQWMGLSSGCFGLGMTSESPRFLPGLHQKSEHYPPHAMAFGTLLIRNAYPPRTTIGPYAKA